MKLSKLTWPMVLLLVAILLVSGIFDLTHIEGITSDTGGGYPTEISVLNKNGKYLATMSPGDSDNKKNFFLGGVPPLDIKVNYWRLEARVLGLTAEYVRWDPDAPIQEHDYWFEKEWPDRWYALMKILSFKEIERIFVGEWFYEGSVDSLLPDHGAKYFATSEYMACKTALSQISPNYVLGTKIVHFDVVENGATVTLRSSVYAYRIRIDGERETWLELENGVAKMECYVYQGSKSCRVSDQYDKTYRNLITPPETFPECKPVTLEYVQ